VLEYSILLNGGKKLNLFTPIANLQWSPLRY
jgi:hypothetical protein